MLIVPSFVTNIWQILAGPPLRPLLRRLWPLLTGICVGTWAGAGILNGRGAGYATEALGVALIIYAGIGLAATQWRVPARLEPVLSPLIGAGHRRRDGSHRRVRWDPGSPLPAGAGAGARRAGQGAGPFLHRVNGGARGVARRGRRLQPSGRSDVASGAGPRPGRGMAAGQWVRARVRDWKRSGAASSWACWRSAPISRLSGVL